MGRFAYGWMGRRAWVWLLGMMALRTLGGDAPATPAASVDDKKVSAPAPSDQSGTDAKEAPVRAGEVDKGHTKDGASPDAAPPSVRADPVSAPPADLAGLDPASLRVRDFGPDDRFRDRWHGDDDRSLALVSIDADHGDSLALPVAFPGSAGAWRGKRLPGQLFSQWAYTGLVSNRLLAGQPSTVTGRLEYDLWVPRTLPAGIRVQARLVLKTKDGLWYEALGARAVPAGPDTPATWEPATALHPGWNRLRVDLREENAALRPRGHQQAWSRYVQGQIREIGLLVQGDRPFSGTFAVDNFATWNATDDFDTPFRLVDFVPPPGDAPAPWTRMEWRFRVNRPLLNPHRPRELRVDLLIEPPPEAYPDRRDAQGQPLPLRLPGYYDQPFRRLRGHDDPPVPYARQGVDLAPTVVRADPDRYQPVGPGVLRARYRPPVAGRYGWRIEVVYVSPITGKEERVVTPGGEFTVRPFPEGDAASIASVPAIERRGFVRVSSRDPRYFEFTDGSFFFPVGHSLRSPVDARHANIILRPHYPGAPRPADRGLRMYEDLFPRFAASGINVSEVWMATWWLDLEWSHVWENYHHLQGYNLENAHKLDRIVELAGRHGQYIHLTLDNHGKAAGPGVADTEWTASPYRAAPPSNSTNFDDRLYGAVGLYSAPPGLTRDAGGYFRSRMAMDLYRDKLRYVVARWGQEPAVMAWELWSELDLTGNQNRNREHYADDSMRAWHREMAAYLRELDPTGRPVTTHYSGHHGIVDWKMAAEPFISYVACDAYTDNRDDSLLAMLGETERKTRELPHPKPYMVTEYGGPAESTPSIDKLYAHFFAGLWWGWMSQSAGTPFFWWYEWIVLEDMFPYYHAFARYIEGEDKRRGPGEPPFAPWPRRLQPAPGPHPGALANLLLADGNVYYALVNNADAMDNMPPREQDRPRHPGALLRLGGVGPGPHTVECWNVWTGEVESRIEDAVADAQGVLDVDIPAFSVLMAVKVRARTPRDAATIAAAGKSTPPHRPWPSAASEGTTP